MTNCINKNCVNKFRPFSREDMAIYSIVKNNTFNGMPLPSIVLKTKTGRFRTLRAFGYEDFKTRLS